MMNRSGFLRILAMIVLITAAPSSLVSQNVAGGLGIAPVAPATPADKLRSTLAGAGITTCAPIIAKAGEFLFEDGDGNFTVQPLGPDVNRWPVVVTIESSHRTTGVTRLTILTIAPAGTCAGSYQQTIAWPQSCDELKRTVFASFNAEKILFRSVRQSELTAGIQLYLFPASQGCVSVKKELIG